MIGLYKIIEVKVNEFEEIKILSINNLNKLQIDFLKENFKDFIKVNTHKSVDKLIKIFLLSIYSNNDNPLEYFTSNIEKENLLIFFNKDFINIEANKIFNNLLMDFKANEKLFLKDILVNTEEFLKYIKDNTLLDNINNIKINNIYNIPQYILNENLNININLIVNDKVLSKLRDLEFSLSGKKEILKVIKAISFKLK